MNRLEKFYEKKGVAYPVGERLDAIASACAEVFGDKVIKINLPYQNFNCHGKATEIAKDVLYLMPFRGGDSCGGDKTTTLFYGTHKIGRCTFVPFQSSSHTFYIKSIVDGDEPTIDLVSAPSWREYI